MKKLLILVLSILLLIPCLTSCILYNVFNPPILLSKEEPWLKEINSENVVQIQTIHTGENIPEMIQKISTVKDKNTIDEIIEKYQNLYIAPLDPMVEYDIPGGAFTIAFTLTTGEVKRIHVGAGFMYRSYSINAPRIDCYENAEIHFEFDNMSRAYMVFCPDNTYFAAISDIYKWNLVEAEALQDSVNPKYNLKMSLSNYTYEFYVYDDNLIKLDEIWYRVTNRNLDDLFGKCNDLMRKQEERNNNGESVATSLYGVYESGAVVGIVTDVHTGHNEAWSETVAGYTFKYRHGWDRIAVLFNDELYTLEEAYSNGYLTKDDIGDIDNWNQYFYGYR